MFSVIFEVHPADGKKDEYLGHAKELKPVIETIEGFIDNERFENRLRPGWVLSHSTWRDEKALIRWRTEARHHLIQEKGRFEVFADYHLRVGEITADTHPPDGLAVREQRLDETETGRSKAATVAEITPADDRPLPVEVPAILRAIGLDPDMAGLDAWEIYDSIYNPGKVLVLCAWSSQDAARTWQPALEPAVGSLRHRAVRVIRDYGMFDRRETPQYYPDVKR